jgi:histidine triad (HIT) family protein
MMDDCIFCKIATGLVPAELLFEDEQVVAFKDIHPITPNHILVIPRKHIISLNDITIDDENLMGHMVSTARELAVQHHLEKSGYRIVFNTGPDAGQSVFHLHLHLLGGRKMPFRFE